MAIMAAACGILIALAGLWSTGTRPTDSQSVVQIVCLVGGLILCFLAVLLARVTGLVRRLDAAPDEVRRRRPPSSGSSS